MTGFILYEGPSKLDGAPIVVIATENSKNTKTGQMQQTWIIRSDIDPIEASRTGADASICGDCPHRGRRNNNPSGTATARSCYVNLSIGGPLQVYKTFKAGRYRSANPIDVGRGRTIRVGSYGDPAAVPMHIWDGLLSEAAGWTGYTHGKANPDPQVFMTSADSLDQALAAWKRGERTFRVISDVLHLRPMNEVLCPASREAGQRTTCENCGLCAGASVQAKNIAIVAHGTGAQHFAG